MSRRGGPRGPYRRHSSRDIPKHRCDPEEERAVYARSDQAGITGTKTTHWRCRTCHVSMGSSTEDLHY